MNTIRSTGHLRLLSFVFVLVAGWTGISGQSSAAGEFIPRLTPGNISFPTGINSQGEIEGIILPGKQGFKFIGSAQFAGTRVRVFGRSNTTISSDGANNFFESRLGASDIDNSAYSQPFMQCSGLSAFYRVAIKELANNGMGSVQLEFRFDTPVRNLHLVVFDIDEIAGDKKESVLINTYATRPPSIENKVNARHWKVVAQGDLSLYNGARTDQITLPPVWYTIRAQDANNFGLLQARNRLSHESSSNQNRDFTVLTNPEAVGILRVDFRGPNAERRNPQPSIGSHAYIGLWHPEQPCGYF